ncbi:MAG: nuclear transport factor 2 family protein [Pseudomonadota bacterium]|uniref:nuclear transport factor 2 family protein n=1 Tax=Phenylobacterium sp. TaxID=1871053 RepID=UPI0025F9AD49|nr:nuclear transport factor 2 family protein [Phenylobacterium sp.]MBT9471429.1 nuclear transport factor 2 family protein [Phenylobacterium sp.]
MIETKPTFVSVLKDALGSRIDPSAANFIEMMAEDFVMEFPYARPGMQPKIEGRKAVVAYLMTVAGSVSVDTVDNVVVHETADPEVVIVEFEAHGRALKVDEPYDQRYISVIRARGGRMIHYKDYWNPIQGLKAQIGSAAVEAFMLGGAA